MIYADMKGIDIKTEEVIKAVEESIAHWERMIKQMKTFYPEMLIHENIAYNHKKFILYNIELKEFWHGGDCPLCLLFQGECVKGCPLFCCNISFSPWRFVNQSNTVKDWLINAENRMLPTLQKALVFAKNVKTEMWEWVGGMA